ncbi:nucleotidyltransferase domain-containing protein [Candidatus Poribacteria bacterium]|nr:nucleotidyltransferase domain-containing protein [Candidatus Poribacteria bacterium]
MSDRAAPTHEQQAREKITEMVRRIRDEIRPDRIILFGSYARGTAGPDSDVDLLDDLRQAVVHVQDSA